MSGRGVGGHSRVGKSAPRGNGPCQDCQRLLSRMKFFSFCSVFGVCCFLKKKFNRFCFNKRVVFYKNVKLFLFSIKRFYPSLCRRRSISPLVYLEDVVDSWASASAFIVDTVPMVLQWPTDGALEIEVSHLRIVELEACRTNPFEADRTILLYPQQHRALGPSKHHPRANYM